MPRTSFFARLACVALAAMIALGAAPRPAAAKLRITVGGADFQPIAVAVPSARPATPALDPLARGITELLRRDVDLARHFSLVPPNTYLSGKADAPANARAWQNVGASGAITVDVLPVAGGVSLAFGYLDVTRGKETLSRTCPVSPAGAGPCVHAFLDALVEALTGERGIFSTRVAFVRQEGRKKTIWSCDMDGEAPRRLIDDGGLSLLPSWDAGGEALFYTGYGTGRSVLYRRALAGGPAHVMSGRRGLNMSAAPSPDGKTLALTLSHEGSSDIYLMDEAKGSLTRLTRSWGQDVSPTWSPDGARIAFISSRSGAPHLYVMKADGSEQKRLTFQGNYVQEPDWSPRADGRIVFTARDEHLRYDLFSISPEGGSLLRLTEDAGNNDGPSFAPDGRHIVFASTRGKGPGRTLYIMDEEGRKVRPLGLPPGDVETPAWSPWSR